MLQNQEHAEVFKYFFQHFVAVLKCFVILHQEQMEITQKKHNFAGFWVVKGCLACLDNFKQVI